MAHKGIREFDAKRLLAKYLNLDNKVALVSPETNIQNLKKTSRWLGTQKLVVKIDQLVGKRGKNNLILLNSDFNSAIRFIKKNMGKTATIRKIRGKVTHFLIEPFVQHKSEYYLAIKSERHDDVIYFSRKGGVDIEENWNSVVSYKVPVSAPIKTQELDKLLKQLPENERKAVGKFLEKLYSFYLDFGFVYLEINPFTIADNQVVPLDLVAKLDDTTAFENSEKWGNLEFPNPFGRDLTKEELYIKNLDEKTGASLKLTVLNPKGRVWTMVAGGGASVIYADTICDLGFGSELANYGEYSGNPNPEETYLYAKTILDLMTNPKNKISRGKILLIGGGIANFTDVSKTFDGIILALKEYAQKLRKEKIKIYVRRGGPNYKEGLKRIEDCGKQIKVPIKVFGPETHMTRIVPLALKEK